MLNLSLGESIPFSSKVNLLIHSNVPQVDSHAPHSNSNECATISALDTLLLHFMWMIYTGYNSWMKRARSCSRLYPFIQTSNDISKQCTVLMYTLYIYIYIYIYICMLGSKSPISHRQAVWEWKCVTYSLVCILQWVRGSENMTILWG